ncbi:hypothetical protein [Foetidibacter luteolus]|uniref:hypothetical protein n=1 Tax=Foetidibacter luteolus TaxID=2608880 RepID=UPI00129A2BC9|nr:hypothetical protein [Foetidibacter luteolus]
MAQTSIDVQPNSVKVVNGELTIENATKTVQGYLYNMGNGLTQFKEITGLENAANLISGGVFFVSKKYAGTAKATINGLTVASISSTEASYTQQLQAAKMGSLLSSYPDPFSARNAALEQISQGVIQSATIVVVDNQQWYVGSNNSEQNGNYAGTSTTGGIADIQFSQANGFSPVASLAHNKINYYFGVNAGLYYINSTYPIFAVYAVDGSDQSFESKIQGRGFFKQYFGEAQGMQGGGKTSSRFFKVDNAKAIVTLEADELWLQQWRNFEIFSYKTIFLGARKIIMADADLIAFESNARNGDGSPSNFSANFSEIQFSNNMYPIGDHPTDYWYLVSTYPGPDVNNNTGSSSARTKTINLNFGDVFLNNYGEGTLFYFGSENPSVYIVNTTINCNVKNLHVANINTLGLGSGLIYFGNGTTGLVSNTSWNFNIDNYIGNDKLLGDVNLTNNASSQNNQITINLKKAIRRPVVETAAGGTNCMFYVHGGYSGSSIIVKLNADYAKDMIGNPFDIGETHNKYIISGTYLSAGTQEVLQFIPGVTNFDNVFLKDCTLISKTGIQAIGNPSTSCNLKASNLTLSWGYPSTITFFGQTQPTVITDLSIFNP